jgi:hypothetical protein
MERGRGYGRAPELDVTANGTPKIVRKNHGRGHSYYVDGVKIPGATTVLNGGYPKHLEKWAAESSANYAVDHWDELAEMRVSERLKLITGARFEDRDPAARRGQDVHALAQRLARGDDVPVPDELVGHVDAYLAFLDEWEPRELLVEAPVANLTYGYCGTLDAIADLVDETRWLYDLKTTRSGVYKESACQLAAYRYAEYVLAGDEVRPMPEVERCGVVWLKADRTFEFVPVEVDEATFEVFLCALRIAAFDARDDVIGAPLQAEGLELF